MNFVNLKKTPDELWRFLFSLSCFALVFSIVFLFCHQFSEPPGVNGYFYLKQIAYFRNTHEFYFKDHSLAFGFLFLFDLIFSNELLSFQFGIALFSALLITSLAGFFNDRTRPTKIFLFFIFPVFISSLGFFTELQFEFFKTLVGTSFFVLGWMILYRQKNTSLNLKQLIGLFLALLISILSHKSMIVLVFLLALSQFLVHSNLKKIKASSWIIFTLLGISAVLGFTFLFPRSRELISFLLDEVGFYPDAWWTWTLKQFSLRNYLPALGIFLSLSWTLFWLNPKLRRKTATTYFLTLLTAISIIPFFKPSIEGASYRLLLISGTLSAAFLLAYFYANQKTYFGIFLGFVGAVSLLSYSPQNSFFLQKMDPETLLELKNFLIPADYLTAHHGLEFAVDYRTGIRARSFAPPAELKGKAYRLAYIPFGNPIWEKTRNQALNKTILVLHPDYQLLKETDWQDLKKTTRVPPHWRNPEQERPDHIWD